MAESLRYYGLDEFLASKSPRLQRIVRSACETHDARVFSSRRADEKPIASHDQFTPRMLHLWWRTNFPVTDPRDGAWFQWITCARTADEAQETWKASFQSACAALPEVPEFAPKDTRALAGIVDIRLSKEMDRPLFIGAFELFSDVTETEPPFLVLSWHPKLAAELLASISRRCLQKR